MAAAAATGASAALLPAPWKNLRWASFPFSLSTTLLALSVAARFSELLCNLAAVALDLVRFPAS